MEKKKWVILLLLWLFLVPLMISVVSAQQKGIIVTLLETFFGPIGNFFDNIIVAKLLLIALVAMLVYSIAAFLPFMPESDTVRWAISIVVAVLAFLFVPLEDIKVLLASYEAMGVMLTSVVPLVILIVFTFEFRKKMEQKGPEYAVYVGPINKFLLIGFGIYILLKWWAVSAEKGFTNPLLMHFYPVTLVVLIVWIILEKWTFIRFVRAIMKGEYKEAERIQASDLRAQLAEIHSKIIVAPLEKDKENLRKKFNTLVKDYNRLARRIGEVVISPLPPLPKKREE